MEDRRIRVAITHGDTNGIGYELIFKTFSAPEMLELCTPIIYGSPKVAAYHRNALGIEANFSIIADAEQARDGHVNLLTSFEEDVKVELGQATPESGEAALKALDRALTDYRAGLFDVLVTAPLNPKNINVKGFEFKGQPQYIENCLGEGREGLTILLNERFRVGFITDDMPLKEVASSITAENIIDKCTIFFNALKRDFSLSNPRIAVLSLNPGYTPGASVGKEETEILIPAISQLADKGIQAFGPYDAESFFGNMKYEAFDGVVAMYHDQGMVPFMALTPGEGVRYLAGLPVVYAAPTNGVSYDQAGKNTVDETSFRHSIYCAIDAFRHREAYDEPMGNPLKKLYHEKRDESEKVRFSIPKKHENSIKEKQA